MTIQPTAFVAGERLLLEVNDGTLVLTTHRVRLTQRSTGDHRVTSITLASVASCRLASVAYPVLLGLALLSATLGFNFISGSGWVGGLFFFSAIVLVLAYFLGRRSVLEIGSAGAKIEAEVKAMSHDSLMRFIDALEWAKLSGR